MPDHDPASNEVSAKGIYQCLLDEIGTAIREKDKIRFVACFLLPHRFQTFETTISIRTVAELARYFDTMLGRLNELDVAELTRHCTLAEFIDSETIRGCHETKLINRAVMIVEGYIALSTLKCVDGTWKVSESQYAESEPSIPTKITRSAQKLQ